MAVKSVNINDKGFKKAVETLERLSKMQVKVGIQSDAGNYDDGTSVVDVAVWNEYGTDKIPSRPFIRQCFADNSDEAAKMLSQVAVRACNGADPKNALSGVGQWYQDRMKQTLLRFPWVPNKPATIKRKGSSRPLVDTGQLVNSIRYKVEG